MIELSTKQVTQAVAGELFGDATVLISGSVETDSRLLKPGDLFVAKPGEVTDGHLFLTNAERSGAVAALVERIVDGISIPQIKVANSVLALGMLAKFVLDQVKESSDIKVIGITGSNGKTTTKNMLREILSKFGPTVAPNESFNNEVGAPYSILQTNLQTRFLVVEMGAGGEGSIDYLAQIAKPDIGVVLKVGLAHVGEFGGIETTAKIKSELVKALDVNAVAVLNADDGYVSDMASLTDAQKVWFGTSGDAGYQATNQKLSIEGTEFDLKWPDQKVSHVKLQILGEHHVMNALAALTVSDILGLDREKSISAIENMPLAERWRMQVHNRADGVTIINDAYNASPDSMKAALQTLAQLGRSGRRTIAILGEMAELGSMSREQHDALGRVVVRLDINQLVVVGQAAKLIHMGAEQEGSWGGESKFFESIDDALAFVRGMLMAGDLVLVKSSKSANLRHLGDTLMEVGS
ncbi:UDP-N-acetylmuramoyl-tripeptide--D-alanyl-D-alanine ligase [Rhodoluna lacicola]|uniref:UDP-N-acetylmuramoyl-tripeptide--D-alanyl-D-alanine ligase n=1 Tax=Rhodoluna lacicola TaxID=529884 RepID=A0A060JG47_9MICO|nr:UDP-N-acetylmuramoyl-tripeptide--D-alanyl-D-alanine ligase [Rhodoluna lacicola]AIC47665.1 UDP-N-acetylmuramoyl-tripeptide--D-alanyl-D-alanine ligase [Rhodoluna lacicola]